MEWVDVECLAGGPRGGRGDAAGCRPRTTRHQCARRHHRRRRHWRGDLGAERGRAAAAGQHHQGDDGDPGAAEPPARRAFPRQRKRRGHPAVEDRSARGTERRPPRPALRRAPQVGERRSSRRGRGRRRLRARVRGSHEPEGARHRRVADELRESARAHRVRPRDVRARPQPDLPLRARRSGISRGAQHAVRGGSDRRPERRAPDARALAQPPARLPGDRQDGLHASRAPLLRRRRRSGIARGRHRHPRVERSVGRCAPHARLRSQPLAADARADGRRIGTASSGAGSRGGAGAGRRGCPGRAQAACRRGARRSATRARPPGRGRSPGRTRSPGRGRSRRAVAGAGSRARASRQDGARPAGCRRPAAGADPRGRGAGCA